MSGGGWTPGIRRTPIGLSGDVEFLASQNYTAKRAGATFAQSTIPVDADGNRILLKGTFVAPITSGPDIGKYGPYDPQTNEVQTVTVFGAPAGGTFTLTFSGQTTAAIPFNATGPAVEAALVALSNIGPGDVGVTRSGEVYTVTFKGALADTNVAALTATPSLTGGSSPGVSVGTTSSGEGNPTDGRQTPDPNTSGYCFESHNLRYGDSIGGVVIAGSVLAQRVHPAPDATTRTAVAGRIIFQ